jgi:energy-coupling factor transporter ATP-binding protein EcfA2
VITEIEIEGFKSLEKVRLKLGKFNLFVGANASGKSNFFDALRVLQGLGYGFTVDEIFNGKSKSATSEVWEQVRGGGAWAEFRGEKSNRVGKGIRFAVNFKSWGPLAYSVVLSLEKLLVQSESLNVGSVVVSSRLLENENLDLRDVEIYRGEDSLFLSEPPDRSFLGSLEDDDFPEDEARAVRSCVRTLSNVQRIEPSIAVLRDYAKPRKALRMGDRGEGFAALVKTILAKKSSRTAYISWLQQLTPLELDNIKILRGALGEPMFALEHGGQVLPAPVLSDGTLRFAAIAAAFFQPDMPNAMTIEEIENGIHPTRLRLLVELLKSQSAESSPQVFATTHSPVVLAWLDESDYETTFFCKRDEETGASIIKPLSEIPRLVDLVKKYSLGDLLTEGWMETAF